MNIEKLYEFYTKTYNISIDSRKITPGCIFFSLKGNNFNANLYAAKAIGMGASIAIVDEEQYADVANNIFLVNNTLDTLQQLAKYHRSKLNIPVIGLTGSNGKTTTKELISVVLSKKFKTLFTPGNLNNHIGVPLTLLSINPTHEVAVIEMGLTIKKEIELLASISQPTIGYITNFGKAHLEGFGGYEGVIKGKSELYQYLKQYNKTALVNLGDELQKKQSDGCKTISFGTDNSANYLISLGAEIDFVSVDYLTTKIKTQLTGQYNFTNISAAIALGLSFNVSIDDIKNAIENYIPTNNRSQLIQKNNCKIVLDAYNANPSSMAVALANFAQFEGSKTVLLGDMFELGIETEKEHQFITYTALSFNFDKILTVDYAFYACNITDDNLILFENKESLINYLQQNKITTTNLLIKGSRGMALETVLDYI